MPMKIAARHSLSTLLAFALLLPPAWVRADSPSAAVSASAAPAAKLPELPRLQPITFPEPDPAALKELDRLLERLVSEEARTRTDARNAIAEVGASIVPAVRHRVREVHATFDREGAARALEAARKTGRKARKSKEEGKTGDGNKVEGKKEKKSKAHRDEEGDDGDWLDFLLASPHPSDKSWQDLVRLTGMVRILTAVGTTPAVREMIQLYAQFGDLLRIDLQRQVTKLRDKAVPALIEARQHDAKVVQKWANKQLDVLGRAIPGEAVASNDTQLLADVLRAYGRTRDVDAVRVILSFCNSDRVQLREAAREALAAIGDAAIWQIRDQYLGLTGEKPPRTWPWDRLARELFALYDHQRLSEIQALMDEGLHAAEAGNVAAAVDAFDKVLARAPLFERRREMAAAYFARANQLRDGHRDEALAMMRKALRLDPQGERAHGIEAEIACVEGELSLEQGAPDRTAFEHALSLDPRSECARRGLSSLEEKAIERQTHLQRYAAAGAVGVAALLAMVVLARRRASVKPMATP